MPCTKYLLYLFTLIQPLELTAQTREWKQFSLFPDTTIVLAQIEKARSIKEALPDSALNLLLASLKNSERITYQKGVRNAFYQIMRLHYENDRYDEAISYSERLLEAADTVRNKDAVYNAYYYAALSYHQKDLPDRSFDAYINALHFLPDTSIINCSIYCNMGELMHRMGKDKEALQYFEKGMYYYNVRLHQPVYAAECATSLLMNMASVLAGKDINAADSCYQAATLIAERAQLPKELYQIKRIQAFTYNERKLPGKALSTIVQARKILEEHPMPDRISVKYQLDMAAGESYMQLKKYTLSEQMLLRALQQVDTGIINDRAIILHKLSRLYDSIGNIEKAYQYVQETYRIDNLLKTKEVEFKLNGADLRFRAAEKDKELAVKSAEISNYRRNLTRKNLWMVSISAGAAFLLLISWTTYRNLQRKRRIEQQKKEIEHLKATMKGEENERGRLAMELHDGVGSMLAAIKMHVGDIRHEHQEKSEIRQRLDAINNMLQETSAEVRNTAHNLLPIVLSRHGLKEALLHFIQKLKINEELSIKLYSPAFPSGLNKQTELLLYRIIQELIQNAIKHGHADNIEIQLLEIGKQITLTVEDNGNGINNDKTSFSDGIGMTSLQYRVRALKGEVDITSQPSGGTTVHISFCMEHLDQLLNASSY